MKVWLIKIGEGARGGRPFRIDMLAAGLLNRGHQVRLYTSTFCHYEKIHLYEQDTERSVADNYTAVFLRSPGYRNNVSLRRLWDHRLIASKFASRARTDHERPDLILCCLPTLELAAEAVRLGHEWHVPVVIDIRDPWPDVYFRVFPRWMQGLAHQLLAPITAQTRATLAAASAITAVSEKYLNWGLEVAGCPRSSLDGVFGLSYAPPQFMAEELEKAEHRMEAAGVDFRKRLCVFSGTLGSSYDIEGILACAGRIASEPRFADVRFVICGDGDKRPLLASPSLPSNIVYTGWVGQAELRYLMLQASMGFMAYTRKALQSLPNKVYEYMANGVPLISSLEGEARQLIDSTGSGISYRAEDVDSMASAVAALLDDPERRRHAGESGRSIYESKHRPEIVYGEMSRHLERVAEAAKTGALAS